MTERVAVMIFFLSVFLVSPAIAQSVKCPSVIAFKKSGEYVEISRSASACFNSRTTAVRRGYARSRKVLCDGATTTSVPAPTTSLPAPTCSVAPTPTPVPCTFELEGQDFGITQRFTVRTVPAVVTFSWFCVFGCSPVVQLCSILSSGNASCSDLTSKRQPTRGTEIFLINTVGEYYLVTYNVPSWTISVQAN